MHKADKWFHRIAFYREHRPRGEHSTNQTGRKECCPFKKMMNALLKSILISFVGLSCVSCDGGNAEVPTYQAIHEAFINEDLSVMGKALERGIDVNGFYISSPSSDDKTQTTLLHTACFLGNSEAVRTLLNSGANPNLRDGFDRLPIELAIYQQEKDVISVLEDYQLKNGNSKDIDDKEIVGIVVRRRAEEHQKFRSISIVGSNLKDDQVRELLVSMGLRITHAENDPIMTITIDRSTSSRVEYLIDMDAGPLNGGFDQGSFVMTHGFWIHTDVRGGVR